MLQTNDSMRGVSPDSEVPGLDKTQDKSKTGGSNTDKGTEKKRSQEGKHI